MAQYIICEKCNKLVEYKPVVKYEGGTSYTTIKCPECGYEKVVTRNHIHYGNDGLG